MIKGGNKVVSAKNYSSDRIGRTKVERPFKWRTTLSAGKLVPIWCDEVLPNQNKSVDLGALVRSITPLGPTMDNGYLDIFFFAVPRRLLWDHWEEFIAGYNKEAWAQDVVYETPKIKFKKYLTSEPASDAYVHSFMDYLYGACDVVSLAKAQAPISEGVSNTDEDSAFKMLNDVMWIDAMYPRAYVKIWNDWFRSEAIQDELELYTGDNDEFADEFCFNLLDADELPSANKYHNRFTDALPSPVKGSDVLIPMNDLQVGSYNAGNEMIISNFGDTDGDYGLSTKSRLSDGFNPFEIYGDGFSSDVVARNVSNTIRMLRLATQTELLLARDARGGTRYCESLLSHFGVHNGDARLQRSEYLGSVHIGLSVVQVTNNAQSSDGVLGNVGGQSMTKFNEHFFSKAFSEHMIIFALATIRTNLSYSSGVRKMYQRKNRFDHIWPEFKHIGDVPLYSRELSTQFIEGGDFEPDHVFGYTPYGSELREGYNANSGLFRGQLGAAGLGYLTYQENYDHQVEPVLSEDWIKQPEEPVANTLAVQTGPQFYVLFDLKSVDIIPLDPTSDPGLMDHF